MGFLCPTYLNIIEKITAVIRTTVYSTGTEYGTCTTVVLVLVLYVLSEYIHTVNEGLQYSTYPVHILVQTSNPKRVDEIDGSKSE